MLFISTKESAFEPTFLTADVCHAGALQQRRTGSAIAQGAIIQATLNIHMMRCQSVLPI